MKNPAISYNPAMHAVLLRNGRVVPVERYAGKRIPFAVARSKKEARKFNKTIRLTRKRFARDPVRYLNAYMKHKRTYPRRGWAFPP